MITRFDVVLVGSPLFQAGDEALPDSGGPAHAKRMAVLVPAVEFTHHEDSPGIGRPDRKLHAAHALVNDGVRAQLFVKAVMRALVEEIDVVIAQERKIVRDSVGLYGRGHRSISPQC